MATSAKNGTSFPRNPSISIKTTIPPPMCASNDNKRYLFNFSSRSK